MNNSNRKEKRIVSMPCRATKGCKGMEAEVKSFVRNGPFTQARMNRYKCTQCNRTWDIGY